MSWGKAMYNLYKLLRALIAIFLTLILFISFSMLGSCTTKKEISIGKEKFCIEEYHENFYLENYDYWLCLTSDPVCRTDTFYIEE